MDDVGGPIDAAETGDSVSSPSGAIGEDRRAGLPHNEVGRVKGNDSAARSENPIFASFFYDG